MPAFGGESRFPMRGTIDHGRQATQVLPGRRRVWISAIGRPIFTVHGVEDGAEVLHVLRGIAQIKRRSTSGRAVALFQRRGWDEYIGAVGRRLRFPVGG